MTSLLIIAAVVGVMLFFSVAVAPTIFKVLPQEWASVYVRNFFPKYYAVLGVSCLIAGFFATNQLVSVIALACGALFAVSLFALTPAINKASDAKNKSRFGLLHGVSILINLLQLVLLVYALFEAQ